MAYGTGTITSATPVKDLMAVLSTALVGAGLTQVESYYTPASVNWNVAYGNGLFVMIGQSTSTAATSTDGITWTPRALPVSQAWSAVGYGNGLWVAIAQSSATYATSTDGITWTSRQLPVSGTYYQLQYANGLWVTLAAAIALTSPDGINWTQRTLTYSGLWRGLTYGNGTWVAVATNSSVAVTSTDGVTWTQRAMSASVSWYGVAYGNGLFVAVANGGANYNTSPDGINWTTRTWTTASFDGVAFYNGLFVTLPYSQNYVLTSPDGLTWTSRTMPAAYNGLNLAFSPTMAVMALSASYVFTTTDGITWAQRSAPGASTTTTTDVYKSAGSGNSFGSDWYLLLRRTQDTSSAMGYQVAETYDAVNHKASNFGGSNVTVAPSATTFQNPAAATIVDSAFAGNANINATIGTVFSYWFSVTKDRLIVGVKTGTESGFYAGLYDDLLPTGVTQFPLVAAQMPTGVVYAGAIGSASAGGTGGFTREPLQTAAYSLNFEARIYNTLFVYSGSSANVNMAYTPMTSTSALFGNTNSLSRVPLGSARYVNNTSDAIRGLLKDTVMSLVASVAGDTVTAGGKTYVRFAGPTSTVGYFVDTSV